MYADRTKAIPPGELFLELLKHTSRPRSWATTVVVSVRYRGHKAIELDDEWSFGSLSIG